MNFRRPDRQHKRVRANVDLTPLIDVVFQLLIFFMLSATFVVQSRIEVNVPEAESTAKLEPRSVAVTLTHDEAGGRVFLGPDEVADMEELGRRLETRLKQEPDLAVVIRADGHVETQRLINVLDIASRLGLDAPPGIAVRPPSE